MRELRESEVELVRGGYERSTWVFEGQQYTIVDREGALNALATNMLGSGFVSGVAGKRSSVLPAGLAGGLVAIFSISEHTRAVRPRITITEIRPGSGSSSADDIVDPNSDS